MSCFLDVELHPPGVASGGRRLIGVGVGHGGDELVAHRDVERRIVRHDFFKVACRGEQAVKVKAEERQFVLSGGAFVPSVGGFKPHAHHLEESGAVFPVRIDDEVGGGREALSPAADAGEDEAWEAEGQCRAEFVGVEQ